MISKNTKAMNGKELYIQKFQAQLDEREADIAKLKAKASWAKADAQIAMNKQIEAIDLGLEDAQAKLSGRFEVSEAAWSSAKKCARSAWNFLKFVFSDAASNLKN